MRSRSPSTRSTRSGRRAICRTPSDADGARRLPRDMQYRGPGRPASKKDHARENRHLIKELQQRAKAKQADAVAKAAVPVFRMKRFQDVESKLSQTLRPPAPGRHHADFLRKGAGVARLVASDATARPKSSPRADESLAEQVVRARFLRSTGF